MTQSFTTCCVSHNVRCQPAKKKSRNLHRFPSQNFSIHGGEPPISCFTQGGGREEGGVLSWLPQPVSGRRYTAGGMIFSRIARRNARTKCFLIGGKGNVAQLKNFVYSFALRVVFRSQVLFLVPSRSRHPFKSYCS